MTSISLKHLLIAEACLSAILAIIWLAVGLPRGFDWLAVVVSLTGGACAIAYGAVRLWALVARRGS